MYSAYKKDVLSKNNMTVSDYRHAAMWYPENYNTNLNAKGFFHEITHEIHEIIDRIEISTMSLNHSKVIVDILKEFGRKYVEFTTEYVDTYGRCYTMTVTDSLKSLVITKVTFITRLGVYIFLHHPGQHLHVNSRTKVFLLFQIYRNIFKTTFIIPPP